MAMKFLIFFFFLISFLAGCGSPTLYIHPSANLGLIRRVAVIPFKNLTNDRTAGQKVYDIFVTELLSMRLFDVIEYGEVARVMREKGIDPARGFSSDEIKLMGRSLDVQGIILGTVDVYKTMQAGGMLSYPVVHFSVRLIEVQSGMVVWSAAHAGDGLTISYRLFGLGGKGESEVVKEVSREILRTLKPKRFPTFFKRLFKIKRR